MDKNKTSMDKYFLCFYLLIFFMFLSIDIFRTVRLKKPVLPLRPPATCLFRATNVLKCKTGFLFSFKSESYQKSEKALSSKNQSWSLAPISS